VIITLHLVVEDLALVGAGRGDEVLVKELKNIVADVAELRLDLETVFTDGLDVSFVAFLLLLLLTPPLVMCDDTEELRSAVKCLCEGNTEGEFGSCCASHSNGASLTLSDTHCFFTNIALDSNDQYVIELFVIHHFLQNSSLVHLVPFISTRKD